MSLETMTDAGSSIEGPPTEKATFLRRRIVPGAVATVVILGSAAAAFGLTRPPTPVLVSDGEGRISLINVDTGKPAYTVNDAVRAPAGSTILRTEEEGKATDVEVLNPESGEVVASTRIEGNSEIRAVSPFGGAVALMPHRPKTTDLYVPEPRDQTLVTVVWSEESASRAPTR